MQWAVSHDTKLTAYFKANEKYPEARNLLYQDFPSNFVWQPKKENGHCTKGILLLEGCTTHVHMLESTFISELFSLLSKVLSLLRVFAHLVTMSVSHTEMHASCMAFWRMIMNGKFVSWRLELWPVVTSCTISLL